MLLTVNRIERMGTVSIGLLFWILFVLAIVFGFGFIALPHGVAWGGNLLIFILIGLLGWKVFGPVLHS